MLGARLGSFQINLQFCWPSPKASQYVVHFRDDGLTVSGGTRGPKGLVEQTSPYDPTQAVFRTRCGSTRPKMAFVSQPRRVTTELRSTSAVQQVTRATDHLSGRDASQREHREMQVIVSLVLRSGDSAVSVLYLIAVVRKQPRWTATYPSGPCCGRNATTQRTPAMLRTVPSAARSASLLFANLRTVQMGQCLENGLALRGLHGDRGGPPPSRARI